MICAPSSRGAQRRGDPAAALIDEEVLHHALEMAWRNKAPRAVVAEHERRQD
jgi:hypothetical protein